jgi:hypothetical protein
LTGEDREDDLGLAPSEESLEWHRTLEMARQIWEL